MSEGEAMRTATRAAPTARAAGERFEALALSHLESAGLALVARNYRCRYGEIDLVMRDRDTIVFVEVRYRRSGRFGGGIDSVDAGKRAKLVRAAQAYLAQRPRLASRPCRFDVVAFDADARVVRCDWQRHAFEAF